MLGRCAGTITVRPIKFAQARFDAFKKGGILVTTRKLGGHLLNDSGRLLRSGLTLGASQQLLSLFEQSSHEHFAAHVPGQGRASLTQNLLELPTLLLNPLI